LLRLPPGNAPTDASGLPTPPVGAGPEWKPDTKSIYEEQTWMDKPIVPIGDALFDTSQAAFQSKMGRIAGAVPEKLSPTQEGISETLKGAVNSLTTPRNLAYMLGSMGVASTGTAGKILVSSLWTGLMGKNAVENAPQIYSQLGEEMAKPEAERDQKKIASLLTQSGIDAAMVIAPALHATGELNLGDRPGQQIETIQPTEVQNASEVSTPTTVHGDVRPLETPASELPIQESVGRVQPQTEVGVHELPKPDTAKEEVLLTPRVGMGGAIASEFSPPEKISIANEKVNERRAKEGNLPLLNENPKKNSDTYAEAEKRIEADRDAGSKILDQLRDGTKTSVDPVEEAMLIHEAVSIRNQRDTAAITASDPNTSEAHRLEAHNEWIQAEDRLNELDQAAKIAGRSAARVLQFRKVQIGDDWTFQGIEKRARVEKGRPLTPEEVDTIKAQAEQIARHQSEIDRLQKELDDKNRQATGQTTFEDTKKSVTQSERQTEGTTKEIDIGKQRENIISGMKKRLSEGDSIGDLYAYVQKLSENFHREAIRKGAPITRDGITDKIHGVLTKDLGLNIPREFTGTEGVPNTQDLISGIGRSTPLTTDPVKLAKMETREQLQKIGKINRFLQKMAAPFTGSKRKPSSAESRALEKEGRKLARDNGVQVTDPAKQLATSLEAKKTRLRNEIADLDRAISLKEPLTQKTGTVPRDSETDALTAQRDAKKAEYTAIFGDPSMSDSARLKIAMGAAERAEKAWNERLVDAKKGIFNKAVPDRKVTSPELEAIRARTEAVKLEVQELKDLAEPKKTPEEIALQSAKTRIANEIATRLEKIANKDFSKPVRRPVIPDDALRRQKAINEGLKQTIARGFERERLSQRPKWQKALEQVAGAARASALSGYHTLIKLASYDVAKLAEIPSTEAIGAMLSKVPGLRRIFSKANLESGSTIKAIGDFYSNVAIKGLRQAWRVLKTGETESKLIHGKPDYAPPRWYDFFGRLHFAEKAPLVTGAEAMYIRRATDAAIRHGLDPSNEFVKAQINKEAYDYSQRAILQENNMFASAVNQLHKRLEQSNPKTGRPEITNSVISTLVKSLLTKGIVRTPSNYIAQTIARTPAGLITGLSKAAVAHYRGIGNLHPVEANAISALIKTGAVGTAFFVLGMIDATKKENDRTFGGYWEPGRKRGGSDVDWGKIRIFGTQLPHLVTHNPLTESAQMGSTMMRVALSRFRKKDKDTQGMTEGAIKAVVGLAGKAPIASPIMRMGQDRSNISGEILKGLVPQLIQNVAEDMDSKERSPKNTLDEIKSTIPGLRETVPIKK